jgi:hypothetical protein
MNKQQAQLEELKEIRSLMEQSSRFLALSGIAGVIVGAIAIAGIIVAYVHLGLFNNIQPYYEAINVNIDKGNKQNALFLLTVSLVVLVSSLMIGVVFTARKARKQKMAAWDATAKRMFINMAIPLLAGGIYAIILCYHGNISLIAPSMLIFYGMALLNASRYTINDIRYLGIIEISIGLLASVYVEYGLLLWGLGFGIFHIIYGLSIYIKYER